MSSQRQKTMKTKQTQMNQETCRLKPSNASFSGQAATSTAVSLGLVILQLNVEGLATAKLNIIEQIATTNKAAAVLLQETL